MDEPLVSVIVPVYKVESYIQACLDSIVGQTYKNLEIVLIDDGSPDRSGVICDEYAMRDGRIKVLHKKNGGVSEARNLGLKYATGDWVTFVDADDWIDPEHVRQLVETTQNRRVDCVICGYIQEYPHATFVRHIDLDAPLTGGQAIFYMLRPDLYQGFLWNKLFRKDVIDRAELQLNGSLFYLEDLAFCADFFNRSQQICCIQSDSYHYRQRQDSAVYSSLDRRDNIARRLTALDALKITESFCTAWRERRLCAARWYVECTQLLKFVPNFSSGDSEDVWKQLLADARKGVGVVVTAPLPMNMKIKYLSIILMPKICLPFWAKRETRFL